MLGHGVPVEDELDGAVRLQHLRGTELLAKRFLLEGDRLQADLAGEVGRSVNLSDTTDLGQVRQLPSDLRGCPRSLGSVRACGSGHGALLPVSITGAAPPRAI